MSLSGCVYGSVSVCVAVLVSLGIQTTVSSLSRPAYSYDSTETNHDHANNIPILYANLLPARQDGAIILPASQHMNHHLPAGISYQLANMYQLASFKPPTTFFNICAKWLKYCGGMYKEQVWNDHIKLEKGNFNFMIQLVCGYFPVSSYIH